jgi:hypothetical protein
MMDGVLHQVNLIQGIYIEIYEKKKKMSRLVTLWARYLHKALKLSSMRN